MTSVKAAEPRREGVDWSIVVPFVTVVLIWGSTWFVIKGQVGQAPASWTVATRFTIATAGMCALALIRRESLKLPPAAMRMAALVGLTQFCLNFQGVYRAEMVFTSGIMAMVMALMMIPVAIFAWVMFRTRVDRRFVLGSGVALVGIGLLLLKEYRAAPPAGTGAVLMGLGYGAGALIAASVASVAQMSRTARETPTVPLAAWSMGIGAALDIAFALALNGPPPLDHPPTFWAGALYLGLIGTVVPFPLFFDLVRKMGAARASYTNILIPIVAMLISTLLEDYRWTMLPITGAVLAISGMVIVMSRKV